MKFTGKGIWGKGISSSSSIPRPRVMMGTLRLLVPLCVAVVVQVAAEYGFRKLLFSGAGRAAGLQRAGLYSPEFSEDYFKLTYLFTGYYFQPFDPFLGWVAHGIISAGDNLHRDDANTGSRRPVLFYGDSFVRCATPQKQCFEGMLNEDPRFNGSYHLLNYGVNGYGVDQIYLLLRRTVDRYKEPVVIVGIFDEDLDRCAVRVSWQPKPIFTLTGGYPEYHNEHMSPDIHAFFRNHPPVIGSYLYRLAAFGRVLPDSITAPMRKAGDRQADIERINKAIICRMAADLRNRGFRHLFVVFEKAPALAEPAGWRVVFLRKLLSEENIPHMMVRDVFAKAGIAQGTDFSRYVVDAGNHHPNEAYNKLVTEALLQWLHPS